MDAPADEYAKTAQNVVIYCLQYGMFVVIFCRMPDHEIVRDGKRFAWIVGSSSVNVENDRSGMFAWINRENGVECRYFHSSGILRS